jgi:hypothetical protein
MGLSLMAFGNKQPTSDGATRVEITVMGSTVSTPYHASFLLAILGVFLMFMTHSLLKNTDEQHSTLVTEFSFISKVFAHEDIPTASDGWVYFGYEDNPNIWNFEFIDGSLNQMKRGGITILKSLKALNIREDHFNDFTGTFLNFINPAPKVLGKLDKGICIQTSDAVIIGFNKIWIKFEMVTCP